MANGRPTRYKKAFDELAYNYSLLGATDKEIASFLDIAVSTLNNWKKDHPRFMESIKKGKVQADAEVSAKLFHRAKGYEHKETKVFNQQGEIITHDVVKHYAPDPTAAIFWLKNRQPDKWKDRKEVDNNVKSDKPLVIEIVRAGTE